MTFPFSYWSAFLFYSLMVFLEAVSGCTEAEVYLADLADNAGADDVPLSAAMLAGLPALDYWDVNLGCVEPHSGRWYMAEVSPDGYWSIRRSGESTKRVKVLRRW